MRKHVITVSSVIIPGSLTEFIKILISWTRSEMPKMGRISVRQGGAARLCGFVAARYTSFAVATQRRLGSRGAKALPCRSVDGEGQRCARHGPQRAP